jgi:hypothetical protein
MSWLCDRGLATGGPPCKNGSMARRRLVTGLGSGFADRTAARSAGWGLTAAGTTGTAGMGGRSVSVTECLRRRKNDDVFFCSVWVVEWCDSREGGAEGDLDWDENWGRFGVVSTETGGDGAATLDEPNILLKKPGFSFGV